MSSECCLECCPRRYSHELYSESTRGCWSRCRQVSYRTSISVFLIAVLLSLSFSTSFPSPFLLLTSLPLSLLPSVTTYRRGPFDGDSTGLLG